MSPPSESCAPSTWSRMRSRSDPAPSACRGSRSGESAGGFRSMETPYSTAGAYELTAAPAHDRWVTGQGSATARGFWLRRPLDDAVVACRFTGDSQQTDRRASLIPVTVRLMSDDSDIPQAHAGD